MSVSAKEVHLVSRPVGEPVPEDFALVDTALGSPADGQLLVRNDYLSVDPYMRGRMDEGDSYVPAYDLGAVMDGGAVGTVVESASDEVPVGSTVAHRAGWRTHALLPAGAVEVVDTEEFGSAIYLGQFGPTGLTAYAALKYTAGVGEGDTVFISGAGGAVGSAAAAIARELGASKVIGTAGGPEKAARLTGELGYDVGIDYRAGDVEKELREAAPDGIDVYLDNVGGDQLRAAIEVLNDHGRIAGVGAVSQYNATEPVPGPDNLYQIVIKRLDFQGVMVLDHLDKMGEYRRFAADLVREGKLARTETFVDGVENAVDGFLSMMRGGNTGKMVVRLTGD
ncbi:NADP-dependent oxidoreductase [Salininema proteolyticum]|uniref:NADP-dependent oxidoreductase n=1 Tax=Salininema proteolyticum TaxID=1607685 RepID=A0ABV8TZE0_9ACTN